MDYIAGARHSVHADLTAAGFAQIGVDMYRKGDRRIRWVGTAEKVRGIDGSGRKLIVRWPFDQDIRREAKLRRFDVTAEI